MTGTEFGTNASSYSSTLTGTATPTMDGTLIECFGPAFSRDFGNMVGNSTLQILGQLTYLRFLIVYANMHLLTVVFTVNL